MVEKYNRTHPHIYMFKKVTNFMKKWVFRNYKSLVARSLLHFFLSLFDVTIYLFTFCKSAICLHFVKQLFVFNFTDQLFVYILQSSCLFTILQISCLFTFCKCNVTSTLPTCPWNAPAAPSCVCKKNYNKADNLRKKKFLRAHYIPYYYYNTIRFWEKKFCQYYM